MKFFSVKTFDNKTKKVFITALLFSFAIIGLYCYLWVKIIQKNQNIALLLGEVETLNMEKETFYSIKEKMSETAPLREKLTEFFIPKDGVVSFLNKIQSLGTENELEFKVDSVSIEDDASAPDSFENVKLNIEAEGAWADIYRFSTLMELMPLKVFVEKVDLEIVPIANLDVSKSQTESSNAKWKSKMNLSVVKLK